ncbi:MAG: hypothetical protein ACI9XO_001979 [Paraglaciecola sp.]|jgi:hypothetical protein
MKQSILILLIGLFFLNFYVNAPSTVTGTVVDDAGKGLIGASILEKGTSNGTITDIDESFELEVKTKNPILIVSYTGYEQLEYGITNLNKKQTITLNQGIQLEECVVVGLGTVKKQSTSGSNRKDKASKRKTAQNNSSAFTYTADYAEVSSNASNLSSFSKAKCKNLLILKITRF